MQLLLIGHGFLGQAIARVFRDAEWSVMPVSLTGDDGSIPCDVGDPSATRKLTAPDFIIHCAASGHGGVSAYQHVFLDGCRNLTETFPGVPLLFTSSTSVYGQTDGSVVTEESTTLPDRDTSKCLLEAEHVTLGAAGIVVRLAGVYGPGRSVILQKFLSGEAVMENGGLRWLNQIHRDDAARAIFHLVSTGTHGGIFNVSDSKPLTQRDCYTALSEIFSRPRPPEGPGNFARKRAWTHKQVSNHKLLGTGWQPAFPSFLDAAEKIAATL